jgi:hypothetical protein
LWSRACLTLTHSLVSFSLRHVSRGWQDGQVYGTAIPTTQGELWYFETTDDSFG